MVENGWESKGGHNLYTTEAGEARATSVTKDPMAES